uniref:Uncharacterized protein n=1 Tax=Toxoplasma gondii COUG TaxID=1074873 RepID=A0A2G8Y5U6_TOXGO|nr:hypothetical protein TGCOUG_392560 [Toxoplasma gondii COUG]
MFMAPGELSAILSMLCSFIEINALLLVPFPTPTFFSTLSSLPFRRLVSLRPTGSVLLSRLPVFSFPRSSTFRLSPASLHSPCLGRFSPLSADYKTQQPAGDCLRGRGTERAQLLTAYCR